MFVGVLLGCCWGVVDPFSFFFASVPNIGRPKRLGPKISRFFFSLPPEISFFLLSLGGLLVEFCWCLKRSGLQKQGGRFSFGQVRRGSDSLP